MQEIVITRAVRTPIGQFSGSFKNTSAIDLLSVCLEAEPCIADVDHVYAGCILSAGLGQNPARQASLKARLHDDVSAITINKVCGSGMQAIFDARNALIAHQGHVIMAGGMENMSMAPHLLPGARCVGLKYGAQSLLDHLEHDGLMDAYRGLSMGLLADLIAKEHDISREEQESYALISCHRAVQARDSGIFAQEIVPVDVRNNKGSNQVCVDECIVDVNPEKMRSLRPAFSPDGTITAATASKIADGASCVTMMRADTAQAHGVSGIAKIVGCAVYGGSPENFAYAPVGAIKKLMKQIGWDSADLFEINEAFAIVPMLVSRHLNISLDKINIHGGACALGHPLGNSGCRVVVTLLNALRQKGLSRGIAALCVGGGEGIAMAVEMI